MDNASFQHTTQAAPFPSQRPSGFSELDPPGLVFDPAVHLALEAPKWIKPLLTPKTTRQDDDPVKFPGKCITLRCFYSFYCFTFTFSNTK